MFESIIALTSSNIQRIKSMKFLKTFASFNWTKVQIEINCRPRRKHNGPFSFQYTNFDMPPNKMIKCRKTPLESIRIMGEISNSKIELTCIFSEGTSRWVEAKIESQNKAMVNIIEKQLLNILKQR
ncbi:MAG: hypothetical protein ACTSRS_17075 [Candidatus Helarchaeota archaeon]